eukprot:gene8291-115_t
MKSTSFQFGTAVIIKDLGFEHFKSYGKTGEPIMYQDSFINSAVYITDAEAVKQVTIQKKWKKSKSMNKAMEVLLGLGLVVIEDDLWKIHRNLIMPSFSQQNLKNMVKTINKETNRYLQKLERKNLIFPNFISTISELTLSVILVVGFGTDPEMTSELEDNFTNLYNGFIQ